MSKISVLILSIIVITATAVFYDFRASNNLAQIGGSDLETAKPSILPISPLKTQGLLEPVPGFKERVTKKTFGLYITVQTSPVKPDKFNGYHTGVDSEFEETQEEIPVRAIADGTIVARTWATGYGGVIAIRHIINGVPMFAVYGHLDPASFISQNITQVKAGDQIGFLGDNHSNETDGARKHLHLSIYTGAKLDIRGYVQTKEELSPWLDPLSLY